MDYLNFVKRKRRHLVAKTNVFVFRERNSQYTFTFNGSEIEIITEYKYVVIICMVSTRTQLLEQNKCLERKKQDHLADKCRNAVSTLKEKL